MKEGWSYKKLGEVCEILNGFAFKSSNYVPEGIRVIRITNVQKGYVEDDSPKYYPFETKDELSRYLLKEGDMLLSLTGKVGRVALLDKSYLPAFLNQRVACIRVKKGVGLDLSFLFHLLYSQKFEDDCIKSSKGAAQLNMSTIWLASYLVPIPPLSEQQSIVDYLDSAFAKIDAMKANAEKALNEAKALFQASLKEMLEPKEGWNVATIGNLGDIFGRIGFRGYTKNDLVGGPEEGAITLSPSNIQDGRMNYTSCTYISWFKYEESPEIMIKNGDVLIVKTGSSYGKSALVENLPHKATINPQSVVIKNIKINNKFFAYLIKTPWVMAKFDEFVSGTAIPTFSQAKLSQVVLSYPSNDMQNEICEKLDSLKSKVDRLQENYDKISQECDALKQAILRQVFE